MNEGSPSIASRTRRSHIREVQGRLSVECRRDAVRGRGSAAQPARPRGGTGEARLGSTAQNGMAPVERPARETVRGTCRRRVAGGSSTCCRRRSNQAVQRGLVGGTRRGWGSQRHVALHRVPRRCGGRGKSGNPRSPTNGMQWMGQSHDNTGGISANTMAPRPRSSQARADRRSISPELPAGRPRPEKGGRIDAFVG